METVPKVLAPVNDGSDLVPPWAVGWVYLIDSAGGWQKLGWSVDPRRRFDEVTKLPFPCWLAHSFPAGSRNVETRLHDHFAAYRCRGEWFTLPAAAVAVIKGIGPTRTTADLPITSGRWGVTNG